MIKFYNEKNYDYIINHSKDGVTPEGSGIEIINFKSLEYLWNNENDLSFREHATGMLSQIDKYNDTIKIGEYVYKPNNVNNELMKYKHVDCLGNVQNNGKNIPYKFWSKEFLYFINQYKFMICFENSDIFGYASEKPINAYAGGAIPIYWGSKEIYSMINKDAFIINENISEMVNEIKHLDNDDNAYFKKWSQPFFVNNLIPEQLKLENIQQKIYSRIKHKLNI
jgi:hypothetical protein